MKTSLLFYTNNFLSAQLLSMTLESLLKHGVTTNSEVVIVSHYPVLEEHHQAMVIELPQMIFQNIDPAKRAIDPTPLYRHISKDLRISPQGNCINYVVGQLPYNPTSIIQQLSLAAERCHGDAVVLMEHDCLYPEDYVPSCANVLVDHEVAACRRRRCHATPEGYLKYRAFYINGMGMQTEPFRAYLANKRRLLVERNFISYLEPYADGLGLKPDGYVASSYGEFDDVLEDDHDILDIQHGLNYNQCFHPSKHMPQLFHEHPYWGSDKPYIEVINSLGMTPKEKALCFAGVQELQL